MGWLDSVSKEITNRNKSSYVLTTSISPTGRIHIGKLRDILLVHFVKLKLRKMEYNVNTILYWDDFDTFSKVNQDNLFLKKQIGLPLCDVSFKQEAYVEKYKQIFIGELHALGIQFDKEVSQSKRYKKGEYYQYIDTAIQNNIELNSIINEFKTSIKKIDIIRIYCCICNKVSNQVNSSKFNKYYCESCGNYYNFNYRKSLNIKLPFNIEWAARWSRDNSDFEPIGKDHAAPNGAANVSKRIAKDIFKIEPPVTQVFEFVGDENKKKLSVSGGNIINIQHLLDIFPTELILWLFFRCKPNKYLSLKYSTENEYLNIYLEYFSYLNGDKKSVVFEEFSELIIKDLVPESLTSIKQTFNLVAFNCDFKNIDFNSVIEVKNINIANYSLLIKFNNWKIQYGTLNKKEISVDLSLKEIKLLKSLKTYLNKHFLEFECFKITEFVDTLVTNDLTRIDIVKFYKLFLFGTTKKQQLSILLYVYKDEVIKKIKAVEDRWNKR